ncbi:unnamed protein product [Urochloa humidicola]
MLTGRGRGWFSTRGGITGTRKCLWPSRSGGGGTPLPLAPHPAFSIAEYGCQRPRAAGRQQVDERDTRRGLEG